MKTKCILCKKEIKGYGNSALPLKKGLCCDECNFKKIIPARLSELYLMKGGKDSRK